MKKGKFISIGVHNNVKSEVDKSENTKYNYYKLIELKNGLI